MNIFNNLIAAGILGLFLVTFSAAPRTFVDLNVSCKNVITSGDLGMLFRQARTSRAGEHVLPRTVQSSISLLRNTRVTLYRFSHIFEQNLLIRQRLVEGAYPIRYDEHAHYLLLLEQESLDMNCSQISHEGGVVLVYCP